MEPSRIAELLTPLELVFGVLKPEEKAEYALTINGAMLNEIQLKRAVMWLRENHNPRHDGHRFPWPKEIIDASKAPAVEKERSRLENKPTCDVCGGDGWLLLRGIWKPETETWGTRVALVCGHCEVGSAIKTRLGDKSPREGYAQDIAENEREFEACLPEWREWQKRRNLLAAAQHEQKQPDKISFDITKKQDYTGREENVPEDNGEIPF